MRNVKSVSVLILLGGMAMPWTVWAQQKECNKIVISADSEYVPLHWYDGKKLTGASIEIATTMLSALHIRYEVRYVGPFFRVLEAAKTGEVDMVTSLKDTEERRDYLAFTSVPLFSNPIVVFAAKNRNFKYSDWQDLIGKKGGVTQGNKFGNGFDEFLKKRLTVEVEAKTYMNFKKLELGRIDYLITGYYNGLANLIATGDTGTIEVLKPTIAESDNFIALSKNSPCLKYLKSINQQLESMREDGKLKLILEKHIALMRVQPATR